MSKKEEEYLARQRALGYEPSLAGMDEEDFDYVPSYVRDRQPSAPLNTVYRPVDRGLAERLYKMFRPTFNDSWKMPDLSGPEYSQTPPGPGPGFDEGSGGNPFRTLEYRVGRDDKGNPVQYASATGSGQNGDGGNGWISMVDPLYPGNGAQSASSSQQSTTTPIEQSRGNVVMQGDGQASQELSKASGKLTPSDNVINFIANYENFKDKPYKVDGRGNWTIGFGHEILPGEDFSNGISEPVARKLLAKQVNEHAAAVNRWAETNNLKLSQQQFDALVSLRYNLGSLEGVPKLRSLILSGNASPQEIRANFEDTISDGVKRQSGLWQRRRDEADMYLNGDYRRKELPLPKELFPDG